MSQLTSGKQVKPQYVVTDRSYAVMDACIRSFNGVSMPSYLRHCYRILTGHVDVKEIRSTTILCLCVAHTVKNVCNKVAKAEANIAKRKAIVCFFVCLQKADSLRKALGVYKLLHTVMTTEVNSKLVDETEFKLRKMCCETGLDENIYDDDSVADMDHELAEESLYSLTSVVSLIEESPFTQLFASVTKTNELSKECDPEHTKNELCNELAFEVIKKLIHLYPLWSIAMHSNVSRFAKNYSSNTGDECGSMRCQSNASVESHFKSVKHNRLEGRLRVRPRVFIQKELQYVLGKLKETELLNSGIPAKTRRKLTDIGGTTERWGKRRRPTRYADPSVANRILKKISRKNDKQSDKSLSYATEKQAASISTEPILFERSSESSKSEKKVGDCVRNSTKMSDEVSKQDDVQLPLKVNESFKRQFRYQKLDDLHIEQVLRLLRSKFPEVDGLQYPGNGACVKGLSLPRFTPLTTSFVQILHLPDHWVCATNIFSNKQNEVWLFDSGHEKKVRDELLIQLTCLLRLVDESDDITIRIRNCSRQPI
jgi:hypothetical protein